MPRRDMTGPLGYGPRTGRQMGMCDRKDFGYGYGCGRRLNHQNRSFGSTNIYSDVNEKAILTDQKVFLQQELENVEKQLRRLDEQQD
ncbi:MAG: DUF5320 domain-containing protein [Erysipelotrichaceae bacterium]|nr:DUF5320 domain-containing protein [Erysipelotrichaceae bacterium]